MVHTKHAVTVGRDSWLHKRTIVSNIRFSTSPFSDTVCRKINLNLAIIEFHTPAFSNWSDGVCCHTYLNLTPIVRITGFRVYKWNLIARITVVGTSVLSFSSGTWLRQSWLKHSGIYWQLAVRMSLELSEKIFDFQQVWVFFSNIFIRVTMMLGGVLCNTSQSSGASVHGEGQIRAFQET